MSVRARIPTISRDIELMIAETLSPAAQSKMLADYGRQQLADAQAANRQALGRVPPHETFVDGRKGADLDDVRPNGRIAFEFQLFGEVLEWIGEQLVMNSPVRTGEYSRSHILLVDGVEVEPGAIPEDGREFVFLNMQPYARKIERGLSPQSPDGVYEAIAAVARRRFGNIAAIKFSYRSALLGYVAAPSKATIVRGARGRILGTSSRRSAANLSASRMENATRQPAIVVTL